MADADPVSRLNQLIQELQGLDPVKGFDKFRVFLAKFNREKKFLLDKLPKTPTRDIGAQFEQERESLLACIATSLKGRQLNKSVKKHLAQLKVIVEKCNPRALQKTFQKINQEITSFKQALPNRVEMGELQGVFEEKLDTLVEECGDKYAPLRNAITAVLSVLPDGDNSDLKVTLTQFQN